MVTGVVWRTVAENKRCPVIRTVAGIALQTRDKMTARFSCGLRTVMATRTGAKNAVVIETCWDPCASRMTGIALGRRLDMAL